MDDALNLLKQRFPLLTSLRVYNGPDDTEALAAFMGILLGAISASRLSAFCFVFPRKEHVAPLTATIYALAKFGLEFPALSEEYAKRGFGSGQNVKLVPGGKVFVFGGVWPGLETRFRLELVNERSTKFTFPVSQILRIEPTNRKRPQGIPRDVYSALKESPLSPLDKLIGTKTFGNTSLCVNSVLYLGGQAEFSEFLASTAFVSASSEASSTADRLVPIGVIGSSGAVRHQDNYQATGQPLVAVSSRIEHVAAACRAAPPRSKVVIVDGARRITELASFDAIAETQNMIIVAEADEEEKLRQLLDRGCRFWRLSLADLEIGDGNQPAKYLARVLRAARNEAEFRTEVISCENSALEKVATALERSQGNLKESEGDETQLVLGQLYGLLMHCAGLLMAPSAEDRDRLRDRATRLSDAAENRIMWLPEDVATPLKDACTEIARVIEAADLGHSKGEAVKNLLDDLRKRGLSRIGFVARSSSNKVIIKQWLERANLAFPVVLPSNADETGAFDALICTTWLNSANFSKLMRQYAAPMICLIAYPFECRWFHQFNQKQSRMKRLPSLSSSEKSELLGISGGGLWPATDEAGITADIGEPPSQTDQDFEARITGGEPSAPIEPGEETVPARLVRLSGEAYAFLTDTARFPIITDLVSGTAASSYKIPRRRVDQMKVGDFLIFRDGGRRDVIQALADAKLGPDAGAMRERAALWHKALRDSGMRETELINELEEVNCPRTPQTVHSWLHSDSMIGPQTRADLEAIAYAVGDQKLLEAAPEIWKAIKTLRSEHLSAGTRLTHVLLRQLPQHLDKLQEGATRIEIDNATAAWIVQVETIADQSSLRPRSHINTILWRNVELI